MIKVCLQLVRQKFCSHIFQADTQITLIRCKNCNKEFWYEKGIDLFPDGERGELLDFCWVRPEKHL